MLENKYMKILLAALGFKNRDICYNLNVILNTINNYSNNVDLLLFGEAFLQGFDSLYWDFNKDKEVAITKNDDKIKLIQENCKKNNVGISFGYYELVDDYIYSSQITIDKYGMIINNYRRVSIGWKEKIADHHYIEGKEFVSFNYLDKNISIALCGDMWYDENVEKIKNMNSDIVLWPVYCDYNAYEWNEQIKYEYAEQANKVASIVLLVNSFCLDKENDDLAKGGCCYFKDGIIKDELPSGLEGIKIIEINND